MKFGIVVFPGTNCEQDCAWAAEILGAEHEYIWHRDTDLKDADCIILPGGFSYGDYLRTGAVARFSPVMDAVKEFSANGGLVIGVCNGFQILLEAGMLPGAMLHNKQMKFVCKEVNLRVENARTPFTSLYKEGDVLRIPINHYEGNYYVDDNILSDMLENEQVILRYSEIDGSVLESSALNGSKYQIAGVCNKEKNVFGLMPHPERAVEDVLGSADGLLVFRSISDSLTKDGLLAG